MSRSKQYLSTLLDQIPLSELESFESRAVFEKIKERISESDDIPSELKSLYRVQHFSDFALSLLWISERVESNPTMLEPSEEEQSLVLRNFQKALGEATESAPQEMASEPILAEATVLPESEPMPAQEEDPFAALHADAGVTTDEPQAFPSSTQGPEPEATVEEDPFAALHAAAGVTTDEPQAFLSSTQEPEATVEEDPFAVLRSEAEPVEEESPFAPSESPSMPQPEAMEGIGSPEEQFAKLVERTVESIQSGSEERDRLVQQLIGVCTETIADESKPEDQRMFCQHVSEFLAYITENQLLDDIRVMNLISNLTDPVAEWARADEASRAGRLDPAIDDLRDFKSRFE
jgi:hypothetical protein